MYKEAQDAGVLIIKCKEVSILYAPAAAAVQHHLPAVLARDVVAETIGQVRLLVALPPGKVHQRVALAS